MYRLRITNINGKRISFLYRDEEVLEIIPETKSLLGTVHVAKVKNIVPNIEAAFLEICIPSDGKEDDRVLVYYSLKENKQHNYADGKVHTKLCEGDDLLIQISKEAVKTKQPIATAHISFDGSFVVLSRGRGRIRFSSKITDRHWKERAAERLLDICPSDMDILCRTACASLTSFESIVSECRRLMQRLGKIFYNASYRKAPAVLFGGEAKYMRLVRTYSAAQEMEVVTDIEMVYAEISEWGEQEKEETKRTLTIRLYEDEQISLSKLYSLETLLESMRQKKVWMRSGAYLVIEPTEALTVIDVNTGKMDAKGNLAQTIKAVNMEAARESARQMRLRNLSGIILIDFIDMKSEADKQELLHLLTQLFSQDSVKTRAVDFTALGLVEITRQKLSKTLFEALRES